jgi:hypothetical protein
MSEFHRREVIMNGGHVSYPWRARVCTYRPRRLDLPYCGLDDEKWSRESTEVEQVWNVMIRGDWTPTQYVIA